MVTRTRKPSAEDAAPADLADTVKDSAQQIWLAGLGAFAKAQAEGSKVFDALVKEGQTLQHQTEAAVERKLSSASQRVADLTSDWTARAGGKVEGFFEEGVARALNRMGVPSTRDLVALQDQVDGLRAAVKQLSTQPRAARTAAKVPAKPAAKRPAARKTS